MTLHLATEAQKIKILNKMKTDQQQLNRDVHSIKDWLRHQHHLPQYTSETMIAAFLIGCRNSIEKTKEKIDNYYTARTKVSDLYSNRDPTDRSVQLNAQCMLVSPLPKLTPNGCRVTMTAFKISDPKKYDIKAFIKRLLSIADIRINNEIFINGDYLILDGNQFSFYHALRLTPTLAKQLIYCSQDVLPIRVKGIIYFNTSPIVEATVNVIKPLLKSKLLNRIIMYSGDHTVLLNHFPKEMLPKEYGGDEKSLEDLSHSWMKRLENERNWFLREGAETVNEDRRPKSHKMAKAYEGAGIDGNFKQLRID